MNKIKAIIFDFDGVIAESVDVKTNAFREMYIEYGQEVAKKVVEHHEANGGISRFEKFKIYHKEFLGEILSHAQIMELAERFSDLVLQKVVEAPYVDGAYDFLVSNYKRYSFFISTGTPTEEIEIIMENRRIASFFQEVYGSPEKKYNHVKCIIKGNDYRKEDVVFVGDALTDRDAARMNGIEFIGRYTTTEEIKKEKYLMRNFSDLEKIIYTF
jgi:phosphoglycolate phosphatase-like HAD superfamily hydrolase